MTARVRSRAALVGLAFALVLGGCGVRAEDQARSLQLAVPDRRLPIAEDDDEPTVPSVEIAATIYLIDDPGRLRATTREVPVSSETSSHLAAVLVALVEGPTAGEAATGLRSAVPSTTEILSVSVDEGLAVVDLSPAFASIGGREELLAVGQLVLTVTTFPGIGSLQVSLAGRPSSLPLPDGSLADGPVTLRDYVQLLGGEDDPAPPGRDGG